MSHHYYKPPVIEADNTRVNLHDPNLKISKTSDPTFLENLTNPIRKRFAENIFPESYVNPEERIWDALKGNKHWMYQDVLKDHKQTGELYTPRLKERTDLLQMVMGQDQKYNTIEESKYKPTKGKDDQSTIKYYRSPNTENALKSIIQQKGWDNKELREGEELFNEDGEFYRDHTSFAGGVLGEFKVDFGEDENGEYISYYDKWDLNPYNSKKGWKGMLSGLADKAQSWVGITPPEIYGRIYKDEIDFEKTEQEYTEPKHVNKAHPTLYTDGTEVTSNTLPLTSFQSQETPYTDLNWLQKANYGFSEGMYNQPVISGNAPGGGTFGKLDKTWTGIKKGVELAENYVPKTVSSDAAFNASNNQINLNAERTGTATTHGSQGIGGGMYMEAPVFNDGDKVKKSRSDKREERELLESFGMLGDGDQRRDGRFPRYINRIMKSRLSTEQYDNLMKYYEEVGSPSFKFYDENEGTVYNPFSWSTGAFGNSTFASGRPGWYNPYDNTVYMENSMKDNDSRIFKHVFEELGHVRQRQNVQDNEDESRTLQFLNKLIPGDAVNHNAAANALGDILKEAHEGLDKPTFRNLGNIPEYWSNVFTKQDRMYDHANDNYENSVHDGSIKNDLITRVFGEDGIKKYLKSDNTSRVNEKGEFNDFALEEFEANKLSYNTEKSDRIKKVSNAAWEIVKDMGSGVLDGFGNVMGGVRNKMGYEDGTEVKNTEIDYAKLYEAIAAREHQGYIGTDGYSPYIRTKGTKGQRAGTEKGSSAYGPVQITTSRLEDLNTAGRRRHYWDDPTADNPEEGGVSWDQEYVDQFKDQGDAFFKYGGTDYPEGGIDPTTKEDISRYNYAGKGDLSGEEYHQKYKDLSTVLLKGTYNILKEDLGRAPSLEELVKHWRGGKIDEEPDYVTDVVKHYNTKEKTDFTKIMGSSTYKKPVLPTGPTLKGDGGLVSTLQDTATEVSDVYNTVTTPSYSNDRLSLQGNINPNIDVNWDPEGNLTQWGSPTVNMGLDAGISGSYKLSDRLTFDASAKYGTGSKPSYSAGLTYNLEQGGPVYAKNDATTSRYMKSFKKFNDGGKVGNTTEDQLTGFVKDRLPHIPEGINPLSDMEMIFQEKYNTELSEDEMDNFLLWATTWKNPATGSKVNMMDEGAYDVRGFWKSGDWKGTDSRGHGSDKWKKPNHVTFSDQSVYSKQNGGSEYDGGTWMDNGAFLPGFHNMHDNDKLLWEFSRDEGPEHLIGGYILPEVTVTD